MSDLQKIKIAAIVGPTASGKTALSVEVARRLDGEIICCDSMQIYRGMVVGTAAPTTDEMGGVPHHLFATVDPQTNFSCSDYVNEVDKIIEDITSRNKLPILVGGTGLYLDSLLLGCGDACASPDTEYRDTLYRIADEKGVEALHSMLSELDPDAAEKIHPNNVRRVVRAIEICRAYGTKSAYDRDARRGMRYDARVVGLRFADRSELYSRIDRRVDAMIKGGLVEETVRLLGEGVLDVNTTASQAIGYKELLPYVKGEEAIEVSVERLKTATRHYAKRQLTWFRAREYVGWVDCDGIESRQNFEKIVNNVVKLFNI